jgi:hypothetical protein
MWAQRLYWLRRICLTANMTYTLEKGSLKSSDMAVSGFEKWNDNQRVRFNLPGQMVSIKAHSETLVEFEYQTLGLIIWKQARKFNRGLNVHRGRSPYLWIAASVFSRAELTTVNVIVRRWAIEQVELGIVDRAPGWSREDKP